MIDNICILLGAGASAEQKLPQWLDLVKGVTNYYGINLKVDKDNLIESVGIIEDNRLSDIHEKLLCAEIAYKANEPRSWARRQIASATRMCLKKQLIKYTLSEIKNNMNLMKQIVESIYERVKNNLMTTVITYNFDDYFEFAYKCLLDEKGELNEYDNHLCSYTIGDIEQHLPSGVSEKLINVYHVHGYIPIFDELYGNELYKQDKTQFKKKHIEFYEHCLNCGIIFSGNDYNTLLDDSIVGWTNMIQYICYSQLPVSIIGFSLTDANFRLLIRRMKKSSAVMKNTTVFLGYPKDDDSKKQQAQTSSETVKYLLKGICQSSLPECIIKEFDIELPQTVKQHFSQYLK